MAIVAGLVLVRIRDATLVDRAVLGGREVVLASFTNGEVDGETASRDERDSGLLVLLISIGALEHVLLIGVRLSFERGKLDHVKAPLHLPLGNLTIARHRDKGLRLGVTLDPLNFPNDIGVLQVKILSRRNSVTII